MIAVSRLIAAANSLAPLPASAVRLASVVNDPETGIEEIAEVVAYDQSLTMSVLRMANSAVSGSRIRITDVREAVMRMGGARVLSAALAAHAKPLFSNPLGEFGLKEDELWRHSVRSALAVELMPLVWRTKPPPAAFAAALLHDIGKLVLDRLVQPEDLQRLRCARRDAPLDACTAEEEVLEVNHAEVGGIVAQCWSLPEEIVRGIIFHHQPELVGEMATDLVYVANIVAHTILPGEDEDRAPFPPITPGARKRLGLDDKMLYDLAEVVDERFAESFEQYLEV